ncbi:MlaC/ttg2D family ABC transporter substrate-binding protein [Aquabacterium sp.]|uniref:MlaC/ttg2D family ABC transporter substrate-binding protein n=1 Tax=Aquabacterium sp. TaxID=1872578 RepID=UPI003D6C8876
MNISHTFPLAFLRSAALVLAVASVSPAVLAQATTAAPAEAPASGQTADIFVKNITADLISTVRGDKAIQSGDLRKAIAVIDTKILPYVNFQRMTASAVGRNWRQATPEQQKRLQEEFRTLLTYTYAGAVAQIKDQVVEFKPVRSRPEDTEVIVRSLVRGKGDPVQIDYRVEKAGDSWKVYDVNVLGAWLVETYRSSFAQEVSASGVDGLIAKLAERNKALAAKKPS